MSHYRHSELLSRGPVCVVRLASHRPFNEEEVNELVTEWNSVADRADCQTLVVDCSNVTVLSTDILGKLILLARRLEQNETKLVLSGLRPEVREVLVWTKLDRFFEIEEDAEQDAAALV